jgi:hypothetical protein
MPRALASPATYWRSSSSDIWSKAAVLVAIDKECQLRCLPEQLQSLVGRRRIAIGGLYLDDVVALCHPRAQLDGLFAHGNARIPHMGVRSC